VYRGHVDIHQFSSSALDRIARMDADEPQCPPTSGILMRRNRPPTSGINGERRFMMLFAQDNGASAVKSLGLLLQHLLGQRVRTSA
jgi:hypothetical protein